MKLQELKNTNWKTRKWNQTKGNNSNPEAKQNKKVDENLRPITLLSMLRKILAICWEKVMIRKVDAPIRPNWTVCRHGGSATEHVLATTILAQEAITSQCYTIHLLMLDMSKAFGNTRSRWTPTNQNHAFYRSNNKMRNWR